MVSRHHLYVTGNIHVESRPSQCLVSFVRSECRTSDLDLTVARMMVMFQSVVPICYEFNSLKQLSSNTLA